MPELRVAGEKVTDLVEALSRFESHPARDGMREFTFSLEPRIGAPLERAVMRIEAELLLLDAAHVSERDPEPRTHEQRAADALMALVLRVSDALEQSGDDRMP